MSDQAISREFSALVNSRNRSRLQHRLRQTAPYLLILVAVGVIQAHVGVYDTELARHPDEAAHFVTGVMVHDYLRSGFDQLPLPFAEQFQAHYPKVAFGHWPPVFYVLQSGWYFIFAATPRSLALFIGLVTAATALLLFRRMEQRHGRDIALVSIALFLVSPLVQQTAIVVGSDSLLTLFSLLAVLAFADYLACGRMRQFVVFAVWAILALLTKGNALALAIFALLAPVLVGRLDLFRSRRWWIIGAIVGAIAAPFYITPLATGMHGFGPLAPLFAFYLRPSTRLFVLDQFARVTTAIIFSVAALGCLILVRKAVIGATYGQRRCDAGVALAWMAAIVIFHLGSPITGEMRYLLPVVPAVLMLFAEGLHTIRDATAARSPICAAITLAVIGIGAVGTSWAPLPPLTSGYARVAGALPVSGAGPIKVLISSNSQGEGAFVAARLARDVHRESYVLRAYKVLADDNWFGTTYRPRFTTTAELRHFLHQSGVHFVVLDNFGQNDQTAQAHHQLLRTTFQNHPDEFAPFGTFSISVGSREFPDAVVVYRNVRAQRFDPVEGLTRDRKVGAATAREPGP